jgi:hypothetical protein
MLISKMPVDEQPDWMDKTGIGVVGTLTLDDGVQITAELTGYNEDSNELVVDVISANRPDARVGQHDCAIPTSRVADFEPQPRETQSWPYSDPCCRSAFSLKRFLLMSAIFLSVVAGSIPLFLLMPEPYRIQKASAIACTLAVIFLTFAATRDHPRYLFTCPAVRPQLPRLLWRHLVFLIVFLAFQTAALAIRPSLPAWWITPDRNGMAPFEGALLLLCFGFAYWQMHNNRSVLARSHKEFSA